MAELRVVGNDGSYTSPADDTFPNAKIRAWSVSMSHVISDVTAFGDSWRAKRGGVFEARGSCSGAPSYNATKTAPNFDGLIASGTTLNLSAATGCSLSGSVVVSSMALSSDKTADAFISFDFEYDGAVNETWDEIA